MRIFSILAIIMGLSGLLALRNIPASPRVDDKTGRWFLVQLDAMDSAISHLAAHKSATAYQLQNDFIALRKAYKRLSVLSDRLFPYETLQWNAPALPRVEDDNPDQLILPQGMPQMEVLLFADTLTISTKEELQHQVQILAAVSGQIRASVSSSMFVPPLVWQGLRDSWIFIVTKGITGFDSPLAGIALAECHWQLEAMDELLSQLALHAHDSEKARLESASAACRKALTAIPEDAGFDGFDRLTFIKLKMVPLALALEALAQENAFEQPQERQPLQKGRVNIFDYGAFDIGFFTPNDRFGPTPERVLLGKKLFTDKRLSGNNQQSCAGCHVPQFAFTDGKPKAIGLDGRVLLRNTPTLWNAALQTRQFYDMRQSLLDFQVGDVVHNTHEMGGSMTDAVEKLSRDADMVTLFNKAYYNEPQSLAVHTLSNAIASYIRTLISSASPTDAFINGIADQTDRQIAQGFNLFAGKAGCATCHFFPWYNGLVPPRYQETEAEVLGVPAFNNGKQLDEDDGRENFTNAAIHKGAFKTPGLRNVALTAPYMHNGSIATLAEVVQFYNDGGGVGRGLAVPNQTLPPGKLNLTEKEQLALIAFLQSLTDTSALAGKAHLPYQPMP